MFHIEGTAKVGWIKLVKFQSAAGGISTPNLPIFIPVPTDIPSPPAVHRRLRVCFCVILCKRVTRRFTEAGS